MCTPFLDSIVPTFGAICELKHNFAGKIRPAKVIIDLPFVSSYNTNMKLKFAGFFRPDHDPPQNSPVSFVDLALFKS
ncbi:MAG: hypothetical protein C3F07_14310 [Anaerolineales bacterium]|nr:MAG: hypothetical protein C3F07_14310 [Anaerolineales bacterium]